MDPGIYLNLYERPASALRSRLLAYCKLTSSVTSTHSRKILPYSICVYSVPVEAMFSTCDWILNLKRRHTAPTFLRLFTTKIILGTFRSIAPLLRCSLLQLKELNDFAVINDMHRTCLICLRYHRALQTVGAFASEYFLLNFLQFNWICFVFLVSVTATKVVYRSVKKKQYSSSFSFGLF